MKRILTSLLLLALAVLAASAQVVDPEPHALTADGPYIFHRPDGSARVVSVDVDGNVIDTFGVVPKSFTVTSHDGRYSFDVTLHEQSRQAWRLPRTRRTFVLSDPHGRLDCLVSILQAGGVIDERLNWSFGGDRLVLIGDVMDRGDDVTQIFWLLYKLEAQAAEAGGSLNMVYGNHESMVLAGDLRYCREKYRMLADTLGITVPRLYGPDTETGRWLGNLNAMMMVGDDIFVHAGLSRQFHELGLAIPEVNRLCSEGLFMTGKERKAHSDTMSLLFGNYGPVWYRGFFSSKEKFGGKMDDRTLDSILERYHAGRVFVGHTIFKSVRKLYGGRVVAVDVDAKLNSLAGRSRAFLIDGDDEYAVFDSGKRKKLASCGFAPQAPVVVGVCHSGAGAGGHAYFRKCVGDAGGECVFFPKYTLTDEMAQEYVSGVDAVIIPGSNKKDTTGRRDYDARVVNAAIEAGKPILGICAGHQRISTVLGGKMGRVQGHKILGENGANVGVYQEAHPIIIDRDSRLYRLLGSRDTVMVNTSHFWCVTSIAEGLKVVALAPDGTIEAYEGDKIMGVQFHPEVMYGKMGLSGFLPIFEDLVSEAAAARKERLKKK